MKKTERKLKNTDLLELSETYRRVLYYFFSFPQQSIGLNDLSENIGSSKTSTKIAVMKLIEEEFIVKEEVGKAWRISANQKHDFMITRKIPFNLQSIYEVRIIEAVYNRVPNARAIILFGSYRWGTDNEKSDIDIAVEILDNKEMQIENLGVVESLGFRKNIKVNLHIFSRNKIDLNLFTNIANGILLDGILEVHP
ncbi:MAG: nucleotidyltransferase domain-containing protein [archaeon]|nr:nucleotidyltransferase domain-containing protein [archaeon]